MKHEYILVSKEIMPQSYEGVLEAKKYIEIDGMSVSEACKKAKISRGSFYKYSNLIYESSNQVGKKIQIIVKAENIKGVLSSVLNVISNENANILTINQDMPIRNIAHITITLDIALMECDINEIIIKIKELSHIKDVSILSIE